jgi:hypothetical protein
MCLPTTAKSVILFAFGPTPKRLILNSQPLTLRSLVILSKFWNRSLVRQEKLFGAVFFRPEGAKRLVPPEWRFGSRHFADYCEKSDHSDPPVCGGCSGQECPVLLCIIRNPGLIDSRFKMTVGPHGLWSGGEKATAEDNETEQQGGCWGPLTLKSG